MEITSDTSVYQISSEGGDVDHVKFGETFEEFQDEVRRLQTIESSLQEWLVQLKDPRKSLITKSGASHRVQRILGIIK